MATVSHESEVHDGAATGGQAGRRRCQILPPRLQGAGDARDAEVELAERFEGSLAFGTAGIRAAMGAGPMRMNRLVAGRVAAERRTEHRASEVLGQMVPHPKKSDVWGLKNTSGATWMSVAPSSVPARSVGCTKPSRPSAVSVLAAISRPPALIRRVGRRTRRARAPAHA